MLQSISNNGLIKIASISPAGRTVGIQARRDFRILRTLYLRGLIKQTFLGDMVRFEITDAGQAILRAKAAGP
jgi:hypothetical protein